MTDNTPKKTTLSIKRRPEPKVSAGSEKQSEGQFVKKSGARAHQRARLAAEEKKKAPIEERAITNADVSRATRHKAATETEIFDVFAPCPRGLEVVLAAELEAIGLSNVTKGRAGCHFKGNWRAIQTANLHSRLATRILVQLAHRAVRTEADIAALAFDTEWERWFGPEMTLWASQLKKSFGGWSVFVISDDTGLPSQMRLQPRRRTPVFNGALDCRLYEFEMVNESYRRKETS
jgi:hypothetical protein